MTCSCSSSSSFTSRRHHHRYSGALFTYQFTLIPPLTYYTLLHYVCIYVYILLKINHHHHHHHHHHRRLRYYILAFSNLLLSVYNEKTNKQQSVSAEYSFTCIHLHTHIHACGSNCFDGLLLLVFRVFYRRRDRPGQLSNVNKGIE